MGGAKLEEETPFTPAQALFAGVDKQLNKGVYSIDTPNIFGTVGVFSGIALFKKLKIR